MLPAKGFVDTIGEVAPEVILIGGGEVLPAYLQVQLPLRQELWNWPQEMLGLWGGLDSS